MSALQCIYDYLNSQFFRLFAYFVQKRYCLMMNTITFVRMMNDNRVRKVGVCRMVGVVLLVFIWLTKFFPVLGEWYARTIYKPLSSLLARISGVFPFSVGDCFIYGSIAGLLIYLLYALVKRRPAKRALWRVAEYLVWVYIWFYLAWGMNYFRADFFARTQIAYVEYSADNFHSFLQSYTDSLNATFVPVERKDALLVGSEVRKGYRQIAGTFGMKEPEEYLRPKPMLVKPLMNGVGVLGYMGPFLNEFNLNPDLLPVQYPATYAHEMAHMLGIAGEAEANLYAYLVCTRSDSPEIRFSGYFSLLSYVLSNAYAALSEQEFKQWMATIRPEVKDLYNQKTAYWQARYSPLVGEVQNVMYDWFLKGNNIQSGYANYSEVVGLLIAYENHTK